jgi:hypothetical protein
MKVCKRCGKEKPLTDFRKKTKAADGLQPWCRECFAEYERLRYQNGDNLRKKQNDKKRIERNKEYVKEYLQTHPCSDCGDTDWWALDFDHLEQSNKSNTISMMIAWNGLDKIKEEIAKCQVLCVKCHRKRTITQCGWWRTID